MEGKEVRLGSLLLPSGAFATTVTSNGSVNAMHDSFMPLSGMFTMLGMMVNSFLWWCWRWIFKFLRLSS